MSKFNIQDATVQAISNTLNEHNLRTPYDRSKGQINQIITLCDEYTSKTGKSIDFDNTWANHYKLILDGNEFEFTMYRDVINALRLLLV